MNWLTPMAGVWLALAVIPPLIVLYFLKLRRRSMPIACTLLWKRSVEDLRANAPFQRLRRSLLLFLQLLALALLALALAQPQVQAGQKRGGRTVLLIDNSASMTASDGPAGATRLDEARRRARDKVEQLHGGGLLSRSAGETMVVAFSDRAEILSRFSGSKAELLVAIDRVRPTHGETRITEAFKLARAYMTNVNPEQAGRPITDAASLELYSDGAIADMREQVLRGESLIYHPLGSPDAANVALVSISVERPYDRPAAVEVFAALVNYGLEEVACDVQLSVDDAVRAIIETRLEPARLDASTGELVPGRNNVVFQPFDQPRDAVIEVANLREDALAADNRARVIVPPPKRLRVALVAPSSFAVRTALEGMSLERLRVLTAEQFDALAAREGGLDDYDVVVLDHHAPGMLPPGRYLSFGATPPVEGLLEYGEGGQQVILDARAEHPILRFVNLDNLFISRFRLIQPADDVQVLAEGSSGPAIVAVSRGELNLVHITFDPLDSNWPLNRSFVTFIVNSIDYLGHLGQGITTQGYRPGEALTARLPAGAADLQLREPDGTVHVVAAIDGTQFSWGPIRLSGVHELSWAAPGQDARASQLFAVNLLSQRESDIRAAAQVEPGEDRFVGEFDDDSRYRSLWPWAIGLCLAVLMLEWWVYHRKAYI